MNYFLLYDSSIPSNEMWHPDAIIISEYNKEELQNIIYTLIGEYETKYGESYDNYVEYMENNLKNYNISLNWDYSRLEW